MTSPLRTALCAVAGLAASVGMCVSITGAASAAAHRVASAGDRVSAASATWQPLGEPGVGGRITSLAVSPTDPRRVLAAGDISGVGLSTDGGRSWQATTGFASWEISQFTWDDAHPSTVWVGTMSGPYESTDGGRTWRARTSGLPTANPSYTYAAPITKVLIDASNDQHLLAFGGNQRQYETPSQGALHYGAVYQSWDGGRSWQTLSDVGANDNILDVVGSPGLRTLYAAVEGKGMMRSTDGGRTWQVANGGMPASESVSGLAIDPRDPDTVWAATHSGQVLSHGAYAAGGIEKTTDGGASWSAVDNGLPRAAETTRAATTSMYSIYRAGDGTLYTADVSGGDKRLYASSDGGAHWRAAGTTVPGFYPSTVPYAFASSADGRFVIAGTGDALIASADHGASWYDADTTRTPTGGWHGNGFSGLLATDVAFDAARPGTMFLTAFDSGNVLRSPNSGRSWTSPLQSYDRYNGGYAVQTGGPGGRDVYAVLGQGGYFNGIAVSTDAGASWHMHTGAGLPARYSWFESGTGAVSVASANGATAFAVLPDHALFKTTDTGASWTKVSLPSPATSVATSPNHGTTYVGTEQGVFAIAGSGSAQPRLLTGSPAAAQRLTVSARGTVYAVGPERVHGGGLWTNASGSWTQLTNNPFVSDVAVEPGNARHIVYTTSDGPFHSVSRATGVWVSCDAGRSFGQDNAGLPMTRVNAVAFDPAHPGSVVVGLYGRGFWRSGLPACG